MAQKAQNASRTRPHASLLTKLVIVVLLAAIGWQLYELREQVERAQQEKAQYEEQVTAKQIFYVCSLFSCL